VITSKLIVEGETVRLVAPIFSKLRAFL